MAEDGRGPSIWDTFCAEPGRILDGDTGAVACDHYHRYAEDVALMAELGVDTYRFSISWPRIQPVGHAGRPTAEGIDFYDRLVDALLGAGIGPLATLYHWDLPQPLEDAGRLARTATPPSASPTTPRSCGDALRRPGGALDHDQRADVLDCSGYALGPHAPGSTLLFDALPAAHHQLLGARPRGRSAARGRRDARSASPTTTPDLAGQPDARGPGRGRVVDMLNNRMFADPVLLGRYPDGFAARCPDPSSDDLATIRAPLDFYGLNYYNPLLVAAPPTRTTRLPFEPATVDGLPDHRLRLAGRARRAARAAGGSARRATATRCRRSTSPRTAAPTTTAPDADGVVDDQPRIDYLDGHLRAVGAAIDDGRRRPRLLHLVAHGQLRVGRGLHPAVRPRARRLRRPRCAPRRTPSTGTAT